ncbi:LPS translocon maturation chaperone LptM [Quisquiliibacterium transsilvanicum]|uniref:Putative small lipoprotein YifL n=1 Tax=Quisquiliibacterium transsilvanicum TaxID=1549638 RepID=A0A7W8HGW6_9BURK|nr:lipoprotein [Quisquiliibacterium transsilvanicum]MBB5271854.1 putative small lipoprotein YifL [Quisquiliibacterium transsilvanicum]
MKSIIALGALAAVLSLAAGCGQRGPLYLPDPSKPRPAAAGVTPQQLPAR